MLYVAHCLKPDRSKIKGAAPTAVQELHCSPRTRLQVLTTLFDMQLVTSHEATEGILLDVHSPQYLLEIKTSKMKVAEVSCTNSNLLCLLVIVCVRTCVMPMHTISHIHISSQLWPVALSRELSATGEPAQVTELPMLLMLPMWLLQWRVVKPMKYMVAGTMLVCLISFTCNSQTHAGSPLQCSTHCCCGVFTMLLAGRTCMLHYRVSA